MTKALFFLTVLVLLDGCSKVDPMEEAINRKNVEVSGVWVWVNTKYPTPFGAITVSTLKTGILYKVLISGKNAEVFREDRLVQKFSFEIRRANEEYFLDILTKQEIEYSAIDMLGGKISLDKKDLTLSFQNNTFKSDMLLSRVEIF
ncbi:MAG: hypothetical protein RIF36_25680 [Imperialibacter sp.]|jgi:hypothetical protein|uniref:hypothetical protein n=1 Tax=Imperialibacter sp. TaxID=2038411 RepID=UPI0032ECCE2B